MKDKIRKYASAVPFITQSNIKPNSPWDRPLRNHDLDSMDLDTPLTAGDINSNRGLIINRLLLSIYEQSMLFLPQSRLTNQLTKAMKEFYDPTLVAQGQEIRPHLEWLAFSFLDSEIQATGKWNIDKLEEYFLGVISDQENSLSELIIRIDDSIDPQEAFRYLFIQQASDFLSEASAMGRATLGNFGPAQSQLLKVYIDECGYGVHDKKHSSLFEECMASVGLSNKIHDYYFHYLPSSMALTNYFHYICFNKNLWFSYLGALYYTEASIPHVNKQISKSLRKTFGENNVNTQYFDEHVHIDVHHRNMVLQDIIRPSVELHGATIIPEIIAGFESFRYLQTLADRDLIAQLDFIEKSKKSFTDKLENHTENYSAVGTITDMHEVKGELSFSHIHDTSELFTVTSGELKFFSGLHETLMKEQDSIIIPAGRLHGSLIVSDDCMYTVQQVSENKIEEEKAYG